MLCALLHYVIYYQRWYAQMWEITSPSQSLMVGGAARYEIAMTINYIRTIFIVISLVIPSNMITAIQNWVIYS